MDRRRTISRVMAVVAAIVACLAATSQIRQFWHQNFACSTDTAYCALSQEKNGYYSGVVKGVKEGTRVRVHFESLLGKPLVPFTAGPGGRLCIVWAQERVYPNVVNAPRSTYLRSWNPLPAPSGCQRSEVTIPAKRASSARQVAPSAGIAVAGIALALLLLSIFLPSRAKLPIRILGMLLAIAAWL
jgi:hypothetical protein